MSNAALQDNQWLMCVTHALGFDDLEIYFEDNNQARAVITTTDGDIELVNSVEEQK